MKEDEYTEVNKLLTQAQQRLDDSQIIIKELVDESKDLDLSDESTTTHAQMIELVLQYRMDSQNALAQLLQIDHGLLQILGIAAMNTSGINIERMKFALGNDDLQYILHALGQLIHSLLLMAQRYQQNLDKASKLRQNLNHRPSKVNTRLVKYCERLQKAVVQQKLCISSLTDVCHHVDQWNLLTTIAPGLDHIAALQGLFAHFYGATQYGLELSKSLYDTISPRILLDKRLDTVLQQAESLLKLMPAAYAPNHFFNPVQSNTTDKLEERASLRRLGNFFNH